MRSFSETTRCPKCGHADITISWCPGLGIVEGQSSGMQVGLAVSLVPVACREVMNLSLDVAKTRKDALNEHLHRKCKRCTYPWLETPLDKAPPLEQLAQQAE